MKWIITGVLVALLLMAGVTSLLSAADVVVTADPSYPTEAPSLNSSDATDITRESAILHGSITGLGGGDVFCRGFEWGLSCANYTHSWNTTGSFPPGDFAHTITGLTLNTQYFWRAFAINDAGQGNSTCRNFTTLALPLPPTDFTITQVGYNSYNISWTMGIAADTTIIRVSEAGYPQSVTSGILVYSGNATWVIVDGLNPDFTTYYYSAWSHNDHGYSLEYAQTYLGHPIGIQAIIFVGGLCGYALWKKDWIRILLSICIIMWGAFTMAYDIKVAAPLIAAGTILLIMGLVRQFTTRREAQA